MEDHSILNDIKKILGIDEAYTVFDPDILIHINSVFMILQQLGVGPINGFSISDKSATWSEYLPNNLGNFECVKSYMALKVKLLFDPPLNSSVLESFKQQINELEWRLNANAEHEGGIQNG